VDIREHVRQLLAMASGANEDALRLALLGYVGGIDKPVASPLLDPAAAGPLAAREPAVLGGGMGTQAAAI
jgi:hypothetical protein